MTKEDKKTPWKKIYIYVLSWNAFLILLFYIITKIFSH